MDAWEEVLVEEILARRGVRYPVRNAQIGHYQGRMIFTSPRPGAGDALQLGLDPRRLDQPRRDRGLPHRMRDFPPQEPAGPGLDLRRRPGFHGVHKLVKRLGIPILFALHNFAYRDAAVFQLADY